MLYKLFYCYTLKMINEILKTNNSFFLYDLLSSKNSYLGIPIDYVDNGNGIEICLEIDLEKINLKTYQGFSNSDFLDMVETSIKYFCKILENLINSGIIKKIPNKMSLSTAKSTQTVDSKILSNDKLDYLDFFKSEYQLTSHGLTFLNSFKNSIQIK